MQTEWQTVQKYDWYTLWVSHDLGLAKILFTYDTLIRKKNTNALNDKQKHLKDQDKIKTN